MPTNMYKRPNGYERTERTNPPRVVNLGFHHNPVLYGQASDEQTQNLQNILMYAAPIGMLVMAYWIVTELQNEKSTII
jgi:hypothetical protein